VRCIGPGEARCTVLAVQAPESLSGPARPCTQLFVVFLPDCCANVCPPKQPIQVGVWPGSASARYVVPSPHYGRESLWRKWGIAPLRLKCEARTSPAVVILGYIKSSFSRFRQQGKLSVNLPARHLYAGNGDAMLESCNHAGERIAVVYTTPAGVRIDAINAGQFFSVNVCDGSANGEPRPSVLVGMTAPGAERPSSEAKRAG
jgi:hypothetical protein